MQHEEKDLVLRKMIIEEFATTRLVKKPLEYQRHDSDEEFMMKHCQPEGVSRKSKDDELTVRDVQRPAREKETEISEKFKKMLEQFIVAKDRDIKKQEEEEKRIKEEDAEMDKYILKMAKKYMRERKKRMEKSIKTEHQFLYEMVYEKL